MLLLLFNSSRLERIEPFLGSNFPINLLYVSLASILESPELSCESSSSLWIFYLFDSFSSMKSTSIELDLTIVSPYANTLLRGPSRETISIAVGLYCVIDL